MRRTSRFAALAAASLLAFSAAACSAVDGDQTEVVSDEAHEAEPAGAEETSVEEADTDAADQVDENGVVEPGNVAELELGESVTYYSFPFATDEGTQKVTITSVEYIEKDDLPADAPVDEMENGVLVIWLDWEQVDGSVQSNQGYLQATDSAGEQGKAWAFREDRLRNGRVGAGHAESGTFTIEIERGPMTLTLTDYTFKPVATLDIDTSTL